MVDLDPALRIEGDPTAKRIAVAFPGQGSINAGQAQKEYFDSPGAVNIFKIADSVSLKRTGLRLSDVCLHGDALLKDPRWAQPAQTTITLARLEMRREQFPNETYNVITAQSLGLEAAIATAGSLNPVQVIDAAFERGQACFEANRQHPGKMFSFLGIEKKWVQEACDQVKDGDDFVVVSGENTEADFVISGRPDLVDKVNLLLNESDRPSSQRPRRSIDLAHIGYASHHPEIMAQAVETMGHYWRTQDIRDPKQPIIINGCVLKTAAEIIALASTEIALPTNYPATDRKLRELGIEVVVEICPLQEEKALSRHSANMNKLFSSGPQLETIPW